MCWYDGNIFSTDSDPNDNGHETESKRNDDGGNDNDGDDDDDGNNGDGIFGPLEGQILGANEPGIEQALNNNDDGQNLEAYDWDGFLDDGTVEGAYRRNCSLTPSSDGGICDIQSSQDYDDVCSGNDGSDSNVHSGNDDDHNDSMQNRNDEEAPNNATIGGDVEAGLQGPQNNIPRQPEEVPI